MTNLLCFSPKDLMDDSLRGEKKFDYSFLLTEGQRLIIADSINNELLRYYNKIEETQPVNSNLEMVLKHLCLT